MRAQIFLITSRQGILEKEKLLTRQQQEYISNNMKLHIHQPPQQPEIPLEARYSHSTFDKAFKKKKKNRKEKLLKSSRENAEALQSNTVISATNKID